MNYREQSNNLYRAFEQLDDIGKIKLVTQLRDKAIEHLQPVIAKVPRSFSDEAIAAFKAEGIDIDWDLATTDVYEFCGMTRHVDLTASQQNAVRLLEYCTQAIEEDKVSEQVRRWVVDAYAGLDDDAINKGHDYSKSQSKKAKKLRGILPEGNKTIGELIRELALSPDHKEETAINLWLHFLGELKNLGLDPAESDDAIEYDFKYGRKKKTLKSFANDVSKYRKQEKSH